MRHRHGELHWYELTDFDSDSRVVAKCQSRDFRDTGIGPDECFRVAGG
jgi:hypothetical protein